MAIVKSALAASNAALTKAAVDAVYNLACNAENRAKLGSAGACEGLCTCVHVCVCVCVCICVCVHMCV